MTRKTLAVALVLIACSTLRATAGAGRFTSITPEGAQVSALVIDPSSPSTIYAGTGGGIFKSLDAGESWTLSVDHAALPGDSALERTVWTLAIDPLHPSTLYAGTGTGEVMKTIDGGATWFILEGKQTQGIIRLVVDPLTPETLYALTATDVLLSPNGGATWNSRRFAALNGRLLALAIDPSHPERLYVGSDTGLFVTNDRGEHWALTFGGPGIGVQHVAVDPNDSATVHAVRYSSGQFELASTNDLGKTWQTLPVDYVRSIVIDPISSTAYALKAAVFRNDISIPAAILVTTDRGRHWSPLPNALPDPGLLVIDPTVDSRLYAASRGDLFKTDNAGASWRSIHVGLTAAYVSAVLVDPSQPSNLFAASYPGVVKSLDGGNHWSGAKLDEGTLGLAGDPQRPSTLFAYNYQTAVRSDDGGESWSAINPGNHVRGIAVDPTDSAVVYAVLADGLARSSDGGSVWTSVGAGQLPLSYYGFDGGAIAVDPVVPTSVYAAGSGGIVKSTDSGTSWKTIYPGGDSYGPYFRALVIDPRVPSNVYALAGNQALKSDDEGQTWRVILARPSPYTGDRFLSLAVDPLESSNLYLATSRGLFRSLDRGEHWAEFNEGLPTRFVTSVSVDTIGNVYASTPRGLFVNSSRSDLLQEATAISVSLRTASGNYVSAKNCGSSFLNANARLAERCETFTLFDRNAGELKDGDSIHLRAANGGFAAVEGGGVVGGSAPVKANRGVPAEWETFVIHRVGGGGRIRSGDSISLQSWNGGYLAAEGGGGSACQCDSRLNANRSVAQSWETFVIEVH